MRMADEVTKKEKVKREEKTRNRICVFWWQGQEEKEGKKEKMEQSELAGNHAAQPKGYQGKNKS
jgi:hypothetical protein